MAATQGTDRGARTATGLLRLAMAVALGGAAWTTATRYSHLNGLLYQRGYLDLEAVTHMDGGAAMLLALVGLATLARRLPWGLFYAVLWFALEAVALTLDGGAALSNWTVAAHAVRILTPLALFFLIRGRVLWAEFLLRAALAATFVAHGIEALSEVPAFLDLLLLSARRLGWSLTESGAGALLMAIGTVDIALALLLCAGRLRAVSAYMAFWGAATLVARMSAGGLVHWPEAVERIHHVAAPAALFILWSARARVPGKTSPSNFA
ncbi:MAG: hypothetical protein ABGY71_03940 [bacterium]|jgi:hypothetical protein|nr:hypothetical protein [Planctomycetota bacterium]HIL51753.1 hypothetical protein [Planctomycetota bacterium]